MKSSVPTATVAGVLVDFAKFTAAWEDTDNGKPGVSMKSAWSHDGHGAIFFFADPHADAIRQACEVAKNKPANTKELPLR